jgi:hypothetical protein
MANIKINNSDINIDKIISFGCSFTAGAELLDHHIHPDSDDIKRKNRGTSIWREEYQMKHPDAMSLMKKEQTISWAGQVATKLGVDFEGFARGGSSVAHALYELEKLIYDHQISDSTLILFGVTQMSRLIYFNADLRLIKSFILSHPQWWPNNWDKMTVLDMHNDCMQVWLQLNYMHRLIELSNKLNGRIQIFPMNGIVPNKAFAEVANAYPLFKKKLNDIYSSSCVHVEESLMGLCKNNLKDQHGENHPKIHIHKLFADYVIGKLICTT